MSGIDRVGVFAKSGEFWTLGLDGKMLTIRDFRGLAYIQRLLRHPGREFHSIDLHGLAGGESAQAARSPEAMQELTPLDRGDAGAMLDAQAKTQYKQRLAELREDLEEAREHGALDRVDKLESEIEFLAREVSRAVGLGGRDRRAASSSERARLAVTRAIKVAIQRASAQHAPLGRLLQLCIKTGTFCSYTTSSDTAVDWQFSVADLGMTSVGKSTDSSTPRESALRPSELSEKTLFVGRQKECSLLTSCLDEVASRRGRIAMIGGAAGVGKSRLAREVAKEAERLGMYVLVGNCHDREDPLAYGPFVEIIETALSRAPSTEAFRELLGHNAPDVALVVPQLRRVMPDLVSSTEMPPEQSRHLMFTGIAEFVARFAAQRATVLLLEDLHWADEATLMLLTFLAPRLASTPVLILGTYRDFAVQPDRPLTKALEDLMHSHAMQEIGLEGLSQEAVAEMLQGISGREMPSPVVSLIYSETEGNPFFVEELFKHLVEQGKFAGGDQPEQALAKTDITVPDSVRLVIGRRVASVSDAAQKALGVAAVIGRSFAFDLLEASNQGASAESLLDALDEAEAAGLIQSTPNVQEAEYQFSHELICQAVLSGLSVPRRQRLHLQVADAIGHLYEGHLEEHTSDLAHHLWQAGSSAQPARTIHFLAMAAKQEITQNAFESALSHLRSARELLTKLPDSAERGLRELDLQVDYSHALVVSKGHYAPEVGDAYRRARELSHQFADSDLLSFSIAFGLWMFHIGRGEHVIARSYADEMLEMAERRTDEGMLAGAYSVLGNSQFYMGEFAAAHSSFEHGLTHYDPLEHRRLARMFGQNAGLSCQCYDSMALWILGFPNQAERRAEDAIAFARRGEPYDLGWCLSQLAMYFQLRLDLQRAEAIVEEGLALSAKHEFNQHLTALRLFRFIGLSLQGKTSREMVAGLRGEGKAPYELGGTWGRGAVAGALVVAGRVGAAAAVLKQAWEMMERNEERYFEAEIYRIDGEIFLKRAESCDPKEQEAAMTHAEQSFRKALDTARKQGAKLFELRAAVSLGRLMISRGELSETAVLVQGVYDWFTEGFDSPELMAARAMLDGLESAQDAARETGTAQRRLHIVR